MHRICKTSIARFLLAFFVLPYSGCSKDDRVVSYYDNLPNKVEIQYDSIQFENGKTLIIVNPYKNPGSLMLKGSMHNHTNNSAHIDGYESGAPKDIAIKFRDVGGFDFYTLTDHNYVTGNPDVDGIVWMGSAMEDTQLTANGHHLLVYNLPSNYQYHNIGTDINRQIEYYHSIGAVVSYAHPEWDGQYQPTEKIFNIENVDFVETLTPSSFSPRAYNILLTKNTVFGFGTDDYHYNVAWPDPNIYFDKSCIYVYADHKDRDSIWQAIMSGCFYASQGARMKIDCTNGMIHVTTEVPSTIDVMSVDKLHPENEMAILSTSNTDELYYQIDGSRQIVWIRINNEQGLAYSQAFRVI